MAVGDIYEIRHEGVTCEATRWNIVTHWRKTVEVQSGLYASAIALADALGNFFGGTPGDLLTIMSLEFSLEATRCNRIYPSIGISASSGSGAGPGGTTITEPLPSDIAAVVSKRTDEPGPRFRGRNYWPGLCENQQDAGLIAGAIATQLQAAWEAYFAYAGPDAESNEWAACVFSQKQVDDTLMPVSADITRVLVDQRCRTLRHRSNGPAIYFT